MTDFHHDQQALYELFLDFQQNDDGIEVTEEDLLEAWKRAKKQTKYKEPKPQDWLQVIHVG